MTVYSNLMQDTAGLSPSTGADVAWQFVRPQQPGITCLTDLKIIASEVGRCLKSGLYATREIAIVDAVRQVELRQQSKCRSHAIC